MRQRIREWPSWAWALAGVFMVGVVATAVLVASDDGDEAAAPVTTTTTAEPATTTSTTPPTTITTTTVTVTTTTPRTTTPPRTITVTEPPGPVPGVVVAVARPGAGSGEVQVGWNAVRGATGYRLLRTDVAGRRGWTVAKVDITTGRVTVATGVVSIWSAEHTYLPARGPLTGTDRSPWFRYVDLGPEIRHYRLQAYNPAGDGPLSAVTSAAPIGAEPGH